MSEWIPTNNPEQWPPRGVEVLLAVTRWNGERLVKVGCLADQGDSFYGGNPPYEYGLHPTHWMPKPTAPAVNDGLVPATYAAQVSAVQQSVQLVAQLNSVIKEWHDLAWYTMRYGWANDTIQSQLAILETIQSLPGINRMPEPVMTHFQSDADYLGGVLQRVAWRMVQQRIGALIDEPDADRHANLAYGAVVIEIITTFSEWLAGEISCIERGIQKQLVGGAA